ncbi:hypothetical protein DHEL01_v205777 [Diaporthe helianthi]|uniref:Oxidase ustYa n=1 Tax=Diaporthe helianthi TaxID=158607 RepID=A0A2P5I000_DIAHE|nr:hypothetical protein DHEL01_v205777 [Diaporthe helianthi]
MSPYKHYADNEEVRSNMESPRTSITEFEQETLIDAPDLRKPQNLIIEHPNRSNCIIVLLSLSNIISVTVLLLFVAQHDPNGLQQQTPATVVYPTRPKWFPPQVGRGQVMINNETALPEMPGLNQSLPQHEAWVAVTHQLHCLYSTKHSFYQLLNHRPGDPPVEPNMEHLNHCWEYLRQGLMCNADVTLEWHKYGEQAGTGWGYQHDCKDWDAIIAWTEDHRMTNDYGIIRGSGARIPLSEPPA